MEKISKKQIVRFSIFIALVLSIFILTSCISAQEKEILEYRKNNKGAYEINFINKDGKILSTIFERNLSQIKLYDKFIGDKDFLGYYINGSEITQDYINRMRQQLHTKEYYNKNFTDRFLIKNNEKINIQLKFKDKDYKYSYLTNGTVEIDKYIGEETKIIIPKKIYEYRVTSIGAFAFKYADITEVKFHDDIKYIQAEAFYGTKLKKIEFSDNIESIGIRAYAFDYTDDEYTDKINVVFPKNLKSIGEGIFENNNAIITADFSKSDGLSSIETSSFSKTNLEAIIYPKNTVRINSKAFYYTKITNYNLPDTVIEIGNLAFSNIDTNKKDSEIIFSKNIERLERKAFYKNKDLKSVTINSKKLTEIEDGVFDENVNLEMVVFNTDSIIDIGARSFYNTKLNNMQLPSKLEKIGAYAFAKELYDNNKTINLVMPNTLASISNNSFENQSLKSLTLSNNLDIIAIEAFKNNKKLDTVLNTSQVTTIYQSAFENTGLKSMFDISSVVRVGQNAFYNSKIVNNFTINKNTQYIDDGAFMFDNSSVNITLDGKITDFPNISKYNVDDKTKWYGTCTVSYGG